MRIAITGVGLNSALGCGWSENLDALRAGRSAIGPVRHLPTEHRELPVGEVPLPDGAPADPTLPRTALLGRLALDEALAAAGLDEMDVRAAALVSGTTVGGMDVAERDVAALVEAGTHLDALLRSDCGTSTERMLDLATPAHPEGLRFGMTTTVSTACSSAANALILAARLLTAGRYGRVVAGGAESLSLFHLNGFNALMILDHAPCRPFAADRAGLNLGEGAAFLVLEPEETACRRGARIYGYLDGWGNACDAFHQTATSDDGEGAFRAMREAIATAGLAPADVGYVNAHGTGTPNNDATELAAMRRVFGSALPPFSSTKSLTGHTTSASGSLEAAFCLMVLAGGFLPLLPPPAQPLRHALCNAFGFGGNDSSLLLSAPDTTPAEADEETGAGEETEAGTPRVWLRSAAVLAAGEAVDFKQYMSAGEARRLGPMLKRTLATAKRALADAGLERPDAILTATALGTVESTDALLRTMAAEGEAMFSPTHFMQSTHNTPAALVAIATQAHGYNVTYAHRALSFSSALLDALMQLRSGRIGNALVGAHDTLPAGREVAAEFVLEAGAGDELRRPDAVELVDVRMLYRPTDYEAAATLGAMIRLRPDATVRRHDLGEGDFAQPALCFHAAAEALEPGRSVVLAFVADGGREVSFVLLSKPLLS